MEFISGNGNDRFESFQWDQMGFLISNLCVIQSDLVG